MIEYVEDVMHANSLWALEKNIQTIAFYKQNGFYFTGNKKFEEDTTEFLVELRNKL